MTEGPEEKTMEPCQNTEAERRPPCLGVLIACGDKNAWSNTFESMCENCYNDVNVGMREGASVKTLDLY